LDYILYIHDEIFCVDEIITLSGYFSGCYSSTAEKESIANTAENGNAMQNYEESDKYAKPYNGHIWTVHWSP